MNFDSVVQNNALYQILYINDYVKGLGFPTSIGKFKLKDEFHVSLLKLPLEDLDDATREKIIEVGKVNSAVLTETPRLTGEFLHVVDTDRERESMIALVDFPNVEKWRAKIREILPDVKFAIPHTTLYTYNCGGIFLNPEDFEKMTRELDAETYQTLHEIWKEKTNA
ncbi:hypothetical protein FWG95_04500 [Candidatus Saccharibacteria bacterium]|nr:hypothetical protein [Candidatus Saccharibacteria bacterium]